MKQNEQGQPAKILIVDDEPQITRVLRTALSTQGYSLRIAANGLLRANAHHPHELGIVQLGWHLNDDLIERTARVV